MLLHDLRLALRSQPWARPLRLANIRRRQRQGVIPDWRALLGSDWERWVDLRDRAAADPAAPRILIATSVGLHATAAAFDSYLAAALTVRGARCDIFLCDQELPACMAADYSWYADPGSFAQHGSSRDLCTVCFKPAAGLFGSSGLGLTLQRYSQFLNDEQRRQADQIAAEADVSELESLEVDGVPVGEHALAGTLRFLARGEIDRQNPAVQAVLRRYLSAACRSLASFRALLDREGYDIVIGHHGIYVPQGIIAAEAARRRTRFVSWNTAYRKGCFIFSHGDTYHRTMLDEPVEAWDELQLDGERTRRLHQYLNDRARGTQDWISFHPPEQAGEALAVDALGLDPDKPLITLLTSVIWDAQLHYHQRAFRNQIEWLLQTIEYFRSRPDLQLAVRVHPAELRGFLPSRQRMEDEVRQAGGALPRNVRIIPPQASVSTYALCDASNAVVIYATKTGIEAAARGIPVIVAGESWLRGKGIGFECADAECYRRILDRLPFDGRLGAERTTRAERYAYHFFFRRMIALPGIQKSRWHGIPLQLAPMDLDTLREGGHEGLDAVMSGVLRGTPFSVDTKSDSLD